MTTSLKKFSKKRNYSSSKLIVFFLIEKLIFSKNNKLYSNTKFIKIKNNIIYFIEEELIKIINNNNTFNKIVLMKENDKPIHVIKDLNLKKKKLVEALSTRLLFIDFEFVHNQYYELAFEIYHSGKKIQSGYFFEEIAIDKNFIFNSEGSYNLSKIQKKKEKLDNEKTIDYQIFNRNKLNFILKDILENIDFLVVHNCNSELKILLNNEINVPKEKCICTSNMFKNSELFLNKRGIFKVQPSLKDLASFLNIKFDASKLHYAYYDVEVTRKCFFNLVDKIINEEEILIK